VVDLYRYYTGRRHNQTSGDAEYCGSAPDEFRANEFVADIMGTPAMNKVIVALDIDNDKVVLNFLQQRIVLPLASLELRQLAAKQSNAIMGIRAEDITLANAGNTSTAATVSLPVTFIEPTGSDTFITAQQGPVTLVSRVSNAVKPKTGECSEACIEN